MIFREATAEDWPAISDISRRSGYEDYINRWGPAYLEEGIVLIAEEDVPMGFSKVEIMADGASWLSGLRVDPNHWRKGVGTRLTEKGVEKSIELGAYAARMLVEEGNYRSRGLSEKMGFRNVGKYRFYEHGIDLEGFSPLDYSNNGYIAVRWKFIRSEMAEDLQGKFLSDGRSIVFANDEGNAFYVLKAGSPFKPVDDAMTVCHSDMPESNFSGLNIMEDFPSAIVYEMSLGDQ